MNNMWLFVWTVCFCGIALWWGSWLGVVVVGSTLMVSMILGILLGVTFVLWMLSIGTRRK